MVKNETKLGDKDQNAIFLRLIIVQKQVRRCVLLKSENLLGYSPGTNQQYSYLNFFKFNVTKYNNEMTANCLNHIFPSVVSANGVYYVECQIFNKLQ